MTPRTRPLADRLWERIDVRGADECWPWLGPTTRAGYGAIGAGGRGGQTLLVHRVAYEMSVGPIPQGHVIDHLCENTVCCNHAHLEAVTQQQNCERGARGRKTHCPHGHPLDGWRRHYMKPLGRHVVHRYCKTCRRAADRGRKRSRVGS